MSTEVNAQDIPVISVTAKCLPEAWEKAVIAVWDDGLEIKTQYDKPDDPPSRDATVMVTVTEPFAEPRIHKNFPGGPTELESYLQEVLDGLHDHWIDPAAGKWTYTYHERLFAYTPTENLKKADSPRPFKKVNQVQYIVDALSDVFCTRRAQAITWMPTADPKTDDPPCLQRVWCRLVEGSDGRMCLNMNTHWRSRDLYKAWFMNAYAFTELQKKIAGEISKKIGKEVSVGRYCDISDSLHIYGSYFANAGVEVEKMRSMSFTSRAWDTTHPAFVMMTEEARNNLAADPDFYAKAQG
ncbi:MAG: thymidylate synthase [Phycisphaerae bacterium]|jgi:thymidylate synthase